jgi:predicted CXXCH cytochrome family protein
MKLYVPALSWLRDVALTVAVVTAGLAAFSAVTGEAYAGLPLAGGPRQATPLQFVETSPHGDQPACASCHRSHTATEEPLLIASNGDNAVCTRCHSAASEDAVSTHSNIDYAYATQPAFTTACTLCHDPHADPLEGNASMVRSTIAGLPVSLVGHTGSDSFDDGLDDGVHDSICVVCHTTTSHNNVYSTELLGEGHLPVGGDCMSCHPHGGDPSVRAGFMPDSPLATPTDTAVPTETATVTPLPSETPVPADTATAEPTWTPSPPEPTATETPDPAAATPTETATPPP